MIRKLVRRNILLYFRDKASVFFSLLSVIIVIVLYMLFLAEFQINSLTEEIGMHVRADDISALVNAWIMAGLLSIITITSPLGALVYIVQDKEKDILKDFNCSPLNKFKYPAACIMNAVITGMIMGTAAFSIYSIYIYIVNGTVFTIEEILLTFVLLVFSSFFGSCTMGFLVSFMKTTGAFSSASTVIGTVIGFVNGLYVPIGSLPDAAASVLKLLPFGNAAALFRKALMSKSIDSIFMYAENTAKTDYMEHYGVHVKIGGTEITTEAAVLYIALTAAACLLIFFLNYRKKISNK